MTAVTVSSSGSYWATATDACSNGPSSGLVTAYSTQPLTSGTCLVNGAQVYTDLNKYQTYVDASGGYIGRTWFNSAPCGANLTGQGFELNSSGQVVGLQNCP
jgi:hypothetical protein